MLLTGALHGDELTATGALWRVMQRLETSAIGGQLTIIPLVNQQGARQSRRHVPLATTDLNRVFPGRKDGELGERLAAALVALMASHDALIDVHTAGWCTNFVLLDNIADPVMQGMVYRWSTPPPCPCSAKCRAEQANLQGLDRCWTTWVVNNGKPAVTIELSGLMTLDVIGAEQGADAILKMLRDLPRALGDKAGAEPVKLVRHEVYSETGGLFETACNVGDSLAAGAVIGRVRTMLGDIQETAITPCAGDVIALNPVSAVMVGTHLVTLGVKPS
ncbi:MAG: succinylglutamate desuccinylase/aspartoacylase family protein [Desulfobacterales bacterium]|nr:succinylglutamate desuccinylase/aspartoacylase family protein [Desulfobacterales bacterium]